MAGRRGIFERIVVVLLTALAFAVPTAITLNLKRAGEDGIETQNHLQSFITRLTDQDSTEWQLTAGAITPKEAREKLSASRANGGHHLEEAAELRLPPLEVDRIEAATSKYTQAVDKLVPLIALGQKEEAAELDETQVDPAYDHALSLLEGQAEQLEEQAKTTQQYGDIGMLATVLLSLILVSVVQNSRKRSALRSEAKHLGEARYRTLIDQSSDLVLVVDRTGHADFVSPSVERLLSSLEKDGQPTTRPPDNASDYLPARAGSLDFAAVLDPLDRERFATALQSAAPDRMSTGEFRMTGREDTSTFEMTVQDLTADPSVRGLVLTGHDVTERLTLQREMEHRALHDELTGLPNRALLADRFEQALIGAERAGTSVGLLLLDLDRFKEVNDTFGHHYGDELLRQIGPRLTEVLRGIDTVARLGGDEFAVLLMDVHGVEDAVEVASSLLATLAIPFHVEGVDLDVEASVGVVISGDHGQDTVTLMQHADIAMYVAKGQHLGVFAYDPMEDGHSATKLAMIGDLRRALHRDELVLYYQPKVNITTGDLVGAEALVRWKHPEHGLVLPDDFIPLAERTGLINPLTRHILDAALAQARIWVNEGRPLPISVNLSARNLHDERFADIVAKLLAAHDVPAHLLELEVTESAIMIDPVRACQMLKKLFDLGIRISLDDFGAGYTSLSQLKALPISEIKIDRSFVMTMAEDRRDTLIVQSVIALGHNLGLTLVAEGVETEPVLTALAGFGCDVFQGYHITRPIPIAAFDAWSAGRRITPMPARRDRSPDDVSEGLQPEALPQAVTGRARSFAGGLTRDPDSPSDHVVFFFNDNHQLTYEATGYVSAGLNYGGHALMIAASNHIRELRATLPQLRVERAQREGRFLALDAEQTLALFMVDGLPDPALFEQNVASTVRTHLSETGVLSVYCELGAVLCKEGNLSGALRVDELWNELQLSTNFSLFCGHPLSDVQTQPGDAIAQICDLHTHVHMSPALDPDADPAVKS